MIHIIDRQTEKIMDVLVNQSDSKIYWDTKMTEAIEDNVLIFEFRMLADSPAAKHIISKNKLTAQDQDGFHRLFIIDSVETSHDANGKILFVSALGDHIELASDEPIPPQTLPGQTAETAVQFVLANTRYQPGQIDFAGSRTITFDTYINPLAALQKIASEFELELRFRVTVNNDGTITRIVDLLKPDSVFDGKEIVFGKDMTGIRRKENTENICTRLIGVGPADEDGNLVTIASVNGGKIYVEDEEAYQRWNNAGRHIWGIFEYQPEDDTEVTPQQLLDATKKEMEKRKSSVVEWEVSAAALEQIPGLEHERVRAGMNVRIKDEAFDPPIYLEARVLETEMPELDDPNGNFSYTFGNYRQVTVVVPPEVKAIQKTLYRNANSWTAAKTIAEKKAQTFEGPTPPTQMNVGDLWHNPASGAFFRWDGSAWVLVSDETGKNTAADTEKVNGKPAVQVIADITDAQQTANQAKQTADNAVQQEKLYNGVSISPADGFKVTRNDQLVQGELNATVGIRFQTRPNTSSPWQDDFYYDVNAKRFKFAGHLEGASGTFGNVSVKGGDFMVQDDTISETKYSIVPKTNLFTDHSFELVPSNNGIAAPNPNYSKWQVAGSPRVLSDFNQDYDYPDTIFGMQAIIVNSSNYIYQHIPYNPGETYTVSAHFTGSELSPSGIPKILVELRDDAGNVKKSWSKTYSTVTYGSKPIRGALTFTVPSDANNGLGGDVVRVSFMSTNGNWIIVDGVQCVVGAIPTLYDPEIGLWNYVNGVKGFGTRKFQEEILWSGASYMHGSQTIYPSKKISDCVRGWVLVWSDYDPGVGVNNYDWVYSFVPKFHVNFHGGSGVQLVVSTGIGGTIASKYVYIHNDKIVGNDANQNAPLNDVCLRYVLEW
ncbi:phage tail spike protein [Caldibacillus debilis]|uniref:Phage minor structural protein, N-terminal region n=1 Tax=Caldibacillus debilis GB1 TaxID=1339248 RepID=A0A420VJ11_9BACI|nr:phage tail spike protein [Caldibacillus debilis]RKO63662.1 phage minor structural protein, N-terminal region [Caldibacillus debilis GB1]